MTASRVGMAMTFLMISLATTYFPAAVVTTRYLAIQTPIHSRAERAMTLFVVTLVTTYFPAVAVTTRWMVAVGMTALKAGMATIFSRLKPAITQTMTRIRYSAAGVTIR